MIRLMFLKATMITMTEMMVMTITVDDGDDGYDDDGDGGLWLPGLQGEGRVGCGGAAAEATVRPAP